MIYASKILDAFGEVQTVPANPVRTGLYFRPSSNNSNQNSQIATREVMVHLQVIVTILVVKIDEFSEEIATVTGTILVTAAGRRQCFDIQGGR